MTRRMADDSSTLPSPDAAGNCPAPRELEALLRDDPSSEQTHALALHLEICASCRSRLDQLAGAACVLPRSDWNPPGQHATPLASLIDHLRTTPAPSQNSPAPTRTPEDPILGPPVAADAIGRFAGYDILERVAEGGMGIVFKARDPVLARVVALKVLAPAFASSPQARDRFLREARAAAAVTHEHVVAIHAVGMEGELPFLVMQFVHGTTLEARLRQGPLDLLSLLRIAHQTSLGLAAAHDQGLIHRDIKPGNILLENGVERVKITDFGLARAVDQPGLTRAGRIAGTPEFMSPEQAAGQAIDARSDLFSLGTVLYTMATGHSPFHAESIPATLRRVADVHPPAVHTLNPGLPDTLTDLIDRLLAKGPEFRPSSAHHVAETLAALLARQATDSRLLSATSPRSLRNPSRPAQRPLGIVLLLGGIIAAAILVPRLSGPRTPPPLRGPPYDATASAGTPAFRVFAPGHSAWTTAQPTLSLAIAAAPPGGIIEVAHSGLLECDPIAITGKALTLRAAAGHTPTLVNRSTEVPLLRSDADLTLQGLELRTAFGDSDRSPPWPERLTTRRLVSARFRERNNLLSLVQVKDTRLTLTDCRLVASSRRDASSDLLSLFGSAQLKIQRTELYNTAGAGILWRRRDAGDAPTLEADECLFYCNQPILLAGSANDRFSLRIDRSTLFGEHVVALPLPMEASLTLRDSVVCSRGFLNPVTENKAAMRWSLTESNNLLIPLASDTPFPPDNAAIGPGSVRVSFAFRDRIAARPRLAQGLTAADFALPPEALEGLPSPGGTAIHDRGAPAARSRPAREP